MNLKVQFRLKQIVDAEPETKETLLRDLEEFAFRGIPNFQKTLWCAEEGQHSEEVCTIIFNMGSCNFVKIFIKDHATKMESHKAKQQELIEQLKQQLEDLELYAYETGEAGLPQTVIVERQKIIIGKFYCCFTISQKLMLKKQKNKNISDQMKNKLQFNVDDLDKYTVEELRQQVDQAIGEVLCIKTS